MAAWGCECKEECWDGNMGMGHADESMGMGAWGCEHGNDSMGMRAWGEESGIRECG